MRHLALILLATLFLSGCGDEDSTADLAVQGIYTGSLSQTGDFALVGSINHGGSFWDLKQSKRLYNWNHQAGEYSFLGASAISKDGNTAVTADRSQGLVFWNTSTGKPMGYWRTPGEINSVALDQRGERALVGLANHQVLVLDRSQGGIVQVLKHDDRVNAVAISPDGRFGVSGSDDQRVKLWDLQTGAELQRYDLGHKVVSVAISPNAQTLFAASQSRQGQLFTAKKADAYALLGQPRQTLSSARFSHDGKYLLTGSSAGEVYLWKVANGQQIQKWRLGRKDIWKPTGVSVRALAFNNGGRFRALGSNGRSYSLSQ